MKIRSLFRDILSGFSTEAVMTLHRTMNGLLVFLFACFAVCSVCTAQPGTPREARTLSSIHIEEGHDIVFEESPSGMFIVTENARIFQKPLLGETAFGRSLADMYRMVQPNGKVPDSLVSADARLAVRRSGPVSAPVPDPPLVPGAGRGPKL
jgi:hypothetical protein